MGGAIRHLTNFLPELSRQDQTREYMVSVSESFPEIAVGKNMKLERVSKKHTSTWFHRTAYDVIRLPERLKREKFDAIVSLLNFGPIKCPIPHIIFQRNSLYYCPHYLNNLGVKEKMMVMLRRRLAVESMKRADLVVTPSNAMANMIKTACPEVNDRHFYTLYHGFDFEKAQVNPRKNINGACFRKPLLFYPSHLGDYKGFRILFEAVRILKEKIHSFQVVLTIGREDGVALYKRYDAIVQKYDITENIKMLGSVDQHKINDYYQISDALIYPSLCESFGFALLEAMGASLPIVAGDTPVNREICDTAAAYYQVTDPADCAAVLEKVINSSSLREQLTQNGQMRLRAKDWSWSRYTKEFCGLIQEVTR